MPLFFWYNSTFAILKKRQTQKTPHSNNANLKKRQSQKTPHSKNAKMKIRQTKKTPEKLEKPINFFELLLFIAPINVHID